jgi:hypothetical protein
MWDKKKSWSIDVAFVEKACQWEEETRQAREEEHRKLGRLWVVDEGDQVMDDEDENTDNMSESGSKDDEDSVDLIYHIIATSNCLLANQRDIMPLWSCHINL